MTTAVTVDTETRERDLAGSITEAGAKARGAIEDAVAAAPSAAAGGRDALDELSRRLDDAPDLNLVAAMGLSVGAGLGLLLGGAPRAVAVAALMPAMAVAFSLMGRRSAQR